MKFNILKKELENGLAIVGRAISGKNPRVILSGIKLELNDNGLFLTASDGFISIVNKIPVKRGESEIVTIIEKGECVIGAKQFSEIIRKLSGNIVELEVVENNVLQVRDNISDFMLNCLNAEEYPVINFQVSGSKFTLSAKEFAEAINQTSYAASDKEIKPVLQGVNLRANGSNLELVATDYYRIAFRIVELKEDASFQVTISAKTLNDIARIAENEEEVTVIVAQNKTVFRFSNTLVATGIINSAFPDVSEILPKTSQSELIIDSNELLASIDRTNVLANSQMPLFRLSMSDSEVKVSAKTQETGSGNDKISSFEYNGERLEITLRSKYVTDCIKAINQPRVKFMFNGDSKAVVIIGTENNKAQGIIMPVRAS